MIDLINAADDHDSYTVVVLGETTGDHVSEWQVNGDVTATAMRTAARMIAQSGNGGCRVTILFHTA